MELAELRRARANLTERLRLETDATERAELARGIELNERWRAELEAHANRA
jgi:hypothetical protein